MNNPRPLTRVFDGWLDPKVPGNPWNAAEKFLLDVKVDGLFFWTLSGTSHYGRFTVVERPAQIKHIRVSPKTLGKESTVTVTLKKQGEDTLMTLVNSGIPIRMPEKGTRKVGTTFWTFSQGSSEIARERRSSL